MALFCNKESVFIHAYKMQYSRGTTIVSIDSIDAEEVLTLDSDADIFQYDGVIYKTNIAWVEELTLTKMFKSVK